MNTVSFGGRCSGKKTIQDILKNDALNRGITVIEVTPESTMILKRKKHLTSIETVQRVKPPVTIWSNPYEL